MYDLDANSRSDSTISFHGFLRNGWGIVQISWFQQYAQLRSHVSTVSESVFLKQFPNWHVRRFLS